MARLDFYKEAYNRELERKDNLEGALNIPMSLLSAMCAIVFFFLTSYDFNIDGGNTFWLSILFLFLTGLGVFTMLASCYFIIRSYHNVTRGYPYQYFDKFQNIDSHFISLREFHADDTEKRDREFEDFLCQNLITTTLHNVEQNQKRISFLHRAKVWLIYCIFSLTVSSVLFGINYYRKDKNEPVHPVRIVENPKK